MDWTALLNNPTLQQALNQGLSALMNGGTNTAAQPGINLSSLMTPQGAIGAGLTGIGLAQKEMPGYVDESTQFLRNRVTSPTGLADQFGGQLEGINKSFAPFFDQQAKSYLDDVQQRIVAGNPQGLSPVMGGPELAGLSNAVRDNIEPQRQQFYGNLALNMMNQQGNAAQSLLNYAKPDPLGEYLATLGMDLLRGTPGDGSTGQPGFHGEGYANHPQLYQQLYGAGAKAAGSVLGTGGTVAGGTGGMAALGTAAKLAAPAAAAAGAAYGTYKIGENNPKIADWNGAQKAGLVAATLGTGGLALFGADKRQKQLKAQYLNEDASSQKGQVVALGDFFGNELAGIGANFAGFDQFAEQMIAEVDKGPNDYAYISDPDMRVYLPENIEQQDAVAITGGKLLLRAYQQTNPNITSLNEIPGLRQRYLDYMTGHTNSAGNSSYSGAAPTNAINSWANRAGLA